MRLRCPLKVSFSGALMEAEACRAKTPDFEHGHWLRRSSRLLISRGVPLAVLGINTGSIRQALGSRLTTASGWVWPGEKCPPSIR